MLASWIFIVVRCGAYRSRASWRRIFWHPHQQASYEPVVRSIWQIRSINRPDHPIMRDRVRHGKSHYSHGATGAHENCCI